MKSDRSRTGSGEGQSLADEEDEILRALARAPHQSLGEVRGGDSPFEPPVVARPNALQPGDTAGRFVVRAVIGAGGMGVVYAADDPELHRRVALKVVRHGSADDDGERVLREARALAALAHPNVVTVYDVGRCSAGVFLAMELVQGATLRSWLEQRPRAWREVVRKFVEAGRGLAAAHAAGIVHRDFKPDNVLVGNDGRVRVTDFGLARSALGDAEPHVPGASDPTRTARAGTPRYMPPEQVAGEPVDARADQYAFCVALRDALGARLSLPAPKAMLAIADRGLSKDREARFASMDALLGALEAVLQRRRRFWMAALAVGLFAGGALLAHAVSLKRAELCAGAGSSLAGIWDDREQNLLRDALTKAGAQAQAAWTWAQPILSQYAGDLVSAQTEACRATRVRGEQSEALLDRRMACLGQRRARLAALVEGLLTPGVAPHKILPAALELPDLKLCADAHLLLEAVPPPERPEIEAQLAPGRAAVARSAALVDLGRYPEAKAAANDAIAAAKKAGYLPLEAEGLLALGVAQSSLRESKDAYRSLEAAALAAEASRHDVVSAKARVRQVFVVGYQLGDKGVREREFPYADAALRRIGDPPAERGILLHNLAAAESSFDDVPRALELRRAALGLLERVYGPLSVKIARTLVGLANDLGNAGKAKESIETYQRAIAIEERAYGPEHPEVGTALMNLGMEYRQVGRFAEAAQAGERALRIREAALGKDNPEVAIALSNVSNVYEEMGRYRDTIDALARALAIWEKGGPRSQTFRGVGENNTGNALFDMGRTEEALAHHRKALELYLGSVGSDHYFVGQTRLALAKDLAVLGLRGEAAADWDEAERIHVRQRGAESEAMAIALCEYGQALQLASRPREALELFRRALALLGKLANGDRIYSGRSHEGAGEALLALGQPAEALAEFELARPLIEASPEAAVDLGRLRWNRALALAKLGRTDEASASAKAAREALGKLPDDPQGLRAQVDAWLAKR